MKYTAATFSLFFLASGVSQATPVVTAACAAASTVTTIATVTPTVTVNAVIPDPSPCPGATLGYLVPNQVSKRFVGLTLSDEDEHQTYTVRKQGQQETSTVYEFWLDGAFVADKMCSLTMAFYNAGVGTESDNVSEGNLLDIYDLTVGSPRYNTVIASMRANTATGRYEYFQTQTNQTRIYTRTQINSTVLPESFPCSRLAANENLVLESRVAGRKLNSTNVVYQETTADFGGIMSANGAPSGLSLQISQPALI